MIRIVMNTQNRRAGAAGSQVSDLRRRMGEIHGYMAVCGAL